MLAEALTGPLPVIYPFIVNDPGEAAQARRRLGAVTVTCRRRWRKGMPPVLARLERLLDEYSTADGLDPARRTRLIAAIRAEAQAAGIEDDLNLPGTASPAEAIPRIPTASSATKESQFGEGLHIWGRGTPCADSTSSPVHLGENIPGVRGSAPAVSHRRPCLHRRRTPRPDRRAGAGPSPRPLGSPFRGGPMCCRRAATSTAPIRAPCPRVPPMRRG